MSDYYQKCIDQIKQLLQSGNVQAAREMIEIELSMPYVPLGFENQLHLLAQQLPLKQSISSPYFDDLDDLIEALGVGGELQEKALNSLAKRNIREDLEDIKKILVSDYSKMVKQSILYILMDQDIAEEIEVILEDCHYQLVPASLEVPLETEGVLEAKNYIDEHFSHNDPSFVLLCNQMIDLLVIDIFPQTYDQGEGELLALEVIERVLKSLGREMEWNEFYRINQDQKAKLLKH